MTKQETKILNWIDRHGEITQRDAFGLGCQRLSARVYDLKRQGIALKSETRVVRNADGSHSNIAVYRYDRKQG